MPVDRRASYVLLCASLVLTTVLFGVPSPYSPGVYYCLVAVQIAAICTAAWKLGASAIRAEAQERRSQATAGLLLIMPWLLFSLLAGFGNPWQATAAENHLRYLVLSISAIAVASGFILLKEALGQAGEHYYSTLGFAAIVLASPLFLIFSSILLEGYIPVARDSSERMPRWIVSLSELLLFFAGVLTFCASAAFAVSLGRAQWLGRKATRAFVIVSLAAVLFLVIRGLEYPDLSTHLNHWYDLPGVIVGIPAIAWIVPCLFGVLLLGRAGDRPAHGARLPGEKSSVGRSSTTLRSDCSQAE